jgi:hypothetical protein
VHERITVYLGGRGEQEARALGLHIGDDHRTLEWRIELEQGHGDLLRGSPDHDPVGSQRILDRGALAEEFRI